MESVGPYNSMSSPRLISCSCPSTNALLQGNWGNALLAYGSLKKKVLSAVSGAAAAAGSAEQPAVAATQAQVAQEASAALIAAGSSYSVSV